MSTRTSARPADPAPACPRCGYRNRTRPRRCGACNHALAREDLVVSAPAPSDAVPADPLRGGWAIAAWAATLLLLPFLASAPTLMTASLETETHGATLREDTLKGLALLAPIALAAMGGAWLQVRHDPRRRAWPTFVAIGVGIFLGLLLFDALRDEAMELARAPLWYGSSTAREVGSVQKGLAIFAGLLFPLVYLRRSGRTARACGFWTAFLLAIALGSLLFGLWLLESASLLQAEAEARPSVRAVPLGWMLAPLAAGLAAWARRRPPRG